MQNWEKRLAASGFVGNDELSVDRRVPGPGWSDRDLTGEPALYICFADFDFSAQNSKSCHTGCNNPTIDWKKMTKTIWKTATCHTGCSGLANLGNAPKVNISFVLVLSLNSSNA